MNFLVILLLVNVFIFFLMNGDASGKWLETRKYQEPEVRTRAHEDQETRYHDLEQEKRYLETREPSALIKTATLEIVDKSLILAPALTVSPE